jgi:hypothetical protein
VFGFPPVLKPEKTTAEKYGELLVLMVTAAIASALNGWLLSLCASFFFPAFSLAFWQWWLTAFTWRCLFSSSSNN